MNDWGPDTLHTYQKTTEFVSLAHTMIEGWDPCHCVKDELRRAGESMAKNLALATGPNSLEERLCHLDYSLGSTAECAACCDVSTIKQLTTLEAIVPVKRRLKEIACMLHGLRKNWLNAGLNEDPSMWNGPPFFPHETLWAYKRGLEFVGWFDRCEKACNLLTKERRELDQSSTGLVLNIAEGNARISKNEQARFWRLALQMETRAEAIVDLLKLNKTISHGQAVEAKGMLRASAACIRGLIYHANSH